jgi:hypothetical protein
VRNCPEVVDMVFFVLAAAAGRMDGLQYVSVSMVDFIR